MHLTCLIGQHQWVEGKCAVCGQAHDHQWVGGRCKGCHVAWSEKYADQMISAASEGNIELIRKMISRGADVNTRSNYKGNRMTALMMASDKGHAAVVKLLIDNGAGLVNIIKQKELMAHAASGGAKEVADLLSLPSYALDLDHQEPPSMESALIKASSGGHVDVVRLLVDKGARIDSKDRDGTMALIFAANSGCVDIVKLLIDKGAMPGSQNNYGNAALLEAAQNGHIGVVQLLIDKGAQLNLQDELGNTALMMAARRGHIEIVKLLADKGAALDLKNYKTPCCVLPSMQDAVSGLELTREEYDARRVKWNQQKTLTGYDEDKKSDGATALIIASQYGHVDIVKLLISKGVGLDLQGRLDLSLIPGDRITALMAAAANGHMAVVKLLIDGGADVGRRWDNKSALTFACENGHLDIVKFLIDKGAELDLEDGDEFRDAVKNGHAGVVKFFMDKGVKLDQKDSDWLTALELAIKSDRPEVVRLLGEAMVRARDAGEAIDPLLSQSEEEKLVVCAAVGDMAAIATMVRQGVNINYQRTGGETALMRASFKGHFDIVQLLVEKGAHLDLWDRNCCTALMMASEKGHADIVKLLIDKGANLNLIGKYIDPCDFKIRYSQALDLARMVVKNSKASQLLEQAGAKAFHDW